MNSVKDNEKYLLPNAKLAKKHLEMIKSPQQPSCDISSTNLKAMYDSAMSYKKISELTKRTLSPLLEECETPEIKESVHTIQSSFDRYGEHKKVKAQDFDEICER